MKEVLVLVSPASATPVKASAKAPVSELADTVARTIETEASAQKAAKKKYYFSY